MILADSSAWFEYLRATGSSAHLELKRLLAGRELVVTDVVWMEVLAGARDDAHERQLRALLGRCAIETTRTPDDYEQAAHLYRRCRQAGATIRTLTDCLIAAVAVRTDIPVLHQDRDFEQLTNHTELRVHHP